ncbi:hypothetical protein U1Q18_027983 [Sarracenia purpurea var. burkii]
MVPISKGPKPGKSIIEEALSIHGSLKKMLRDNSLDENLTKLVRSEKKSLESDFFDFRNCPFPLISEKLAAIETRIQRWKEFNFVYLDPNLAKEVRASPAETGTDEIIEQISSSCPLICGASNVTGSTEFVSAMENEEGTTKKENALDENIAIYEEEEEEAGETDSNGEGDSAEDEGDVLSNALQVFDESPQLFFVVDTVIARSVFQWRGMWRKIGD